VIDVLARVVREDEDRVVEIENYFLAQEFEHLEHWRFHGDFLDKQRSVKKSAEKNAHFISEPAREPDVKIVAKPGALEKRQILENARPAAGGFFVRLRDYEYFIFSHRFHTEKQDWPALMRNAS